MTSIYDFDAVKPNGDEVSLSEFKGEAMVIVNTASKCGFTPQFEELQSLYEEFKDKGFTVLGFPSDQFMNQEFDNNDDIMEFCKVNYGVSFPMFSKVDVKGKGAHPLFKYLIKEKKGLMTSEVKWNFTKFLVDREGNVVNRYAPQTSPKKIKEDLEKIL
ncbi:glutathione peroxidase [Rossellomorea vietnamensis]|jgi:glutathione peroxidase|uniref:Glutathione peroxidase n=2 Tax=Rossellomorea TaxID=2837508 RepID=A0A5D4NGF2_9BACI|nr:MULTISPECIES: glutathione peroxidase [Rossellomorea]TYS12879.1 glutathione peroxidase [Rossellomorea vietnamensis]TYS71391.1 glutathione peroxidase [Rossellomorea aquimaris]